MNTSSSKSSAVKSRLVVLGIILMLMGSGGWQLIAKHGAVDHSHMRTPLEIGGDCLTLAGGLCAFIGWLRIRRTERSGPS